MGPPRSGGVWGGRPPGESQTPLDGQRRERAAEGERGRGERHRALAEQPGSQHPADLERRHPQRRRPARFVRGPVEPDHLVALGDLLAERVQDPARRCAAAHPARPGSSGPPPSAAGPPPRMPRWPAPRRRTPRPRPARTSAWRPACRTARPSGLRARRRGRWRARPPRGAAGRPPPSRAPSAAADSVSRPARRAAASTAGPDSSPVVAEVTRSTRSCASSTMTTSCSGSTSMSDVASIASSAWLVTTMSARAAASLRPLGETTRAERAALRADALLRAHRDLAPGRLGHAGHQLVPVPGGGLLGPLVQPLDLPSQRRGGARIRRVEQRVLRVVRHAAALAGAGTGSCACPSGWRRTVPGRAAAPAP